MLKSLTKTTDNSLQQKENNVKNVKQSNIEWLRVSDNCDEPDTIEKQCLWCYANPPEEWGMTPKDLQLICATH